MRLHRVLVPLAAAIVIVGMAVALVIALNNGKPEQAGRGTAATNGLRPIDAADIAELQSIKHQAEALAIDNKLADAHAKYREFFTRVQGHDAANIKDPVFWDLIERAKI